jgi:indolepyruvate ferredoxin oxidoreductase
MAGLAQKGGAVVSHLRIAARPEDIHAVQIGAGNARLLLGCDLVVSAAREVLGKTRKGITQAMLNSHEAAVGAFTQDPDLTFPGKTLQDAIGRAVGPGHMRTLDMTSLATAVFGDAIMANVIMLGYSYQLGHIPLSAESIIQAIEMNHIAVEENKRAFFLGRLAAHNPAAVKEWLAPPNDPPAETGEESLERTTARRAEFLTAYQDAALAERYERLIHRVRSIEAEKTGGRTALAEAAATNYFRLLAYKDEYEVARLYSDGTFLEQLEKQFEGDYRLTFHFAPPLLPSRDPETGELRKRTFGRWMLPVLRLMARFKFLRGTALDIFGHTAERRMERQLIRDFETRIEEVLQHLKPENHAAAVEIAENYKTIRGFGHIKMTQVAIFKQRENELLSDFHGSKIKKTALV